MMRESLSQSKQEMERAPDDTRKFIVRDISFAFVQDDIEFKINYDEFADSELRILEVDPDSEELRAIFDPEMFPGHLEEVVTGDRSYEGYRATSHL